MIENPTLPCKRKKKGNKRSWCLFVPTSLWLKEDLLRNPTHMAGLDTASEQTARGQFIMFLEMFAALKEISWKIFFKERRRGRWAWLIRSTLHLSLCWSFCVSDWNSSRRSRRLTGWHLNVPESFKWAYLSTSSEKFSCWRAWDNMFAQDVAP